MTGPTSPEMEQLLRRLETIVPIVRQQQHDANRAAETAYFAAQGKSERVADQSPLRVLSIGELIGIDYQWVNTPEACELHSMAWPSPPSEVATLSATSAGCSPIEAAKTPNSSGRDGTGWQTTGFSR